jgi:hypothetical protein
MATGAGQPQQVEALLSEGDPPNRILLENETHPTVPGSTAEEATAPAAAAWSIEDVASWMRASSIPDAEEIATTLASEEMDGEALLGLQSKTEVKEALGLPFGKASKVWHTIQELKGPNPASSGGGFIHKDSLEFLSSAALAQKGVGAGECWSLSEVSMAVSAAQEGLILKDTYELLSSTELAARGIGVESERCWTVAEAAQVFVVMGGTSFSPCILSVAELAKQKITKQSCWNRDQDLMCAQGLEAIDVELAGLEAQRAAIETKVQEAIAMQQEALQAKVTSLLKEREQSLCEELGAEYEKRHAALEAQRQDVTEMRQAQVHTLSAEHRAMLQKLSSADMAVAVRKIQPVQTALIPYNLDVWTDDASLVSKLVKELSAFGTVGEATSEVAKTDLIHMPLALLQKVQDLLRAIARPLMDNALVQKISEVLRPLMQPLMESMLQPEFIDIAEACARSLLASKAFFVPGAGELKRALPKPLRIASKDDVRGVLSTLLTKFCGDLRKVNSSTGKPKAAEKLKGAMAKTLFRTMPAYSARQVWCQTIAKVSEIVRLNLPKLIHSIEACPYEMFTEKVWNPNGFFGKRRLQDALGLADDMHTAKVSQRRRRILQGGVCV